MQQQLFSFFFLSTVQIPYEALGAELSDDYNQRNRLFAIRQGFFILGTVVAAALPSVLIAAFGFPEQVSEQRELFVTVGLIYVTLTIVAVLFLCGNVVWTLRALYAGLPALCYLLSLFVIIKFPLSRQDFR